MRVNGVDVIPLVEAELNRRFPGRADRRATDPDGLRVAWAAPERTWAVTLERVAVTPAGTVDVSVGGEWSFAQTLRHLVMATDAWLGRAILDIEQPFHRIGSPNVEYESDGNDMSIFTTVTPPYPDVLGVRAGRVAMVRDFLATVTSDDLAATRKNPWAPDYPETILSCPQVILGELRTVGNRAVHTHYGEVRAALDAVRACFRWVPGSTGRLPAIVPRQRLRWLEPRTAPQPNATHPEARKPQHQ